MTAPAILLKQEAAAAVLAMSPKTFRRVVAPDVRVVLVDSQARYPVAELERWARERADYLLKEMAA